MTVAALHELHAVARVGSERLAFAVRDVEAVLDAPTLLPVPGANGGLVGQVEHRGETLRAHRLADLLAVRGSATPGTVLIVVRGTRRIALCVDDVEDLAAVQGDRIRAVPHGLDPAGVLRGIWLGPSAGDPMAGLVDADAIIAAVLSERTGQAA
ncbi:MAG: chemotaxis protein CheW [Gemmatimonadetes bacterium]|nr:chemotaxis protein CheW [Gemmatimonadota bacterium]